MRGYSVFCYRQSDKRHAFLPLRSSHSYISLLVMWFQLFIGDHCRICNLKGNVLAGVEEGKERPRYL